VFHATLRPIFRTSTVRPLLALHNATVRRALSPPLHALILLLCLLIWRVSLFVSATQKVEHNDTVIAQAHETLTLMVDAETGEGIQDLLTAVGEASMLLTGSRGTTVILEQARIAPQLDWLQSVGD
jgi:hypothetical protein